MHLFACILAHLPRHWCDTLHIYLLRRLICLLSSSEWSLETCPWAACACLWCTVPNSSTPSVPQTPWQTPLPVDPRSPLAPFSPGSPFDPWMPLSPLLPFSPAWPGIPGWKKEIHCLHCFPRKKRWWVFHIDAEKWMVVFKVLCIIRVNCAVKGVPSGPWSPFFPFCPGGPKVIKPNRKVFIKAYAK